MIFPIGHDQQVVRRIPWVTFCLIAANFAVFLYTHFQGEGVERNREKEFARVLEYWQGHSWLRLPKEFKDALEPDGRQMVSVQEDMYNETGYEPSPEQQKAEQQTLDDMARAALGENARHPLRQYGFVPAKPNAISFFLHMFLHAGWLHLLFNMYFLYLAGPPVEDVYGRLVYLVFYLGAGGAACLAHTAANPDSVVPVVGASGAIAGIMGAFLVRYWRVKILFAYFFGFWARGTFEAPTYLMLPLWLAEQVWFALLYESEGGVAFWAHIGGFAAGAMGALAIKGLRLEEKFFQRGIERQMIRAATSVFDEGLDRLAAGDPAGARGPLQAALDQDPGNVDIHRALWQSYEETGEPAAGQGYLVSAIEAEIYRKNWKSARALWSSLIRLAGSEGPPLVRWKLARGLKEAYPFLAGDVFVTLTDDPEAGELAPKAREELKELERRGCYRPEGPEMPR